MPVATPSSGRREWSDPVSADQGDALYRTGDWKPTRLRTAAVYKSDELLTSAPSYSDAEKRALDRYTGQEHLIQGPLRAGRIGDPEIVAGLDSAIERTQLAQDTRVFRGTDLEGLRPGDQVMDRGYTSTSMAPDVARSFGSTILDIEVPAGTPVAKGSEAEKEYILGRGAVLEILGEDAGPVRTEGGYVQKYQMVEHRVLHARLVGYAD